MLYPIGIQDFTDLRTRGCAYVDKTALLHRLAREGKYYFLSRPRRFGKSLLVSTMEAYFSGKKELFRGLAIENLEEEWTAYPVLRFDLSGQAYSEEGALRDTLDVQLERMEKRHGVVAKAGTPASRFRALIEATQEKTGRQVVILFDEYDKPIVDNLWGNEALADAFRAELQGFYSVMKAMDGCIRLGFLTGVTKLGKLSVFSGLNNLQDISMEAGYSSICGISQTELETSFEEGVRDLARANGLTEEACYTRLAEMYDGYHFHQNAEGVYNPFSLLNAFKSGEFRHYWFETGTPTFLVRFLKKERCPLEGLTRRKVSASLLSGVNAERPDILTLLYQAGYLTLRGYDPKSSLYTLGYPNREVESGFMESLSEFYTPIPKDPYRLSVYRFVEDFESGDVAALMRRLTAFFADGDYAVQGDAELYFQNTLYVLFKLMGQQVEVERHTSNGRMDVLVQTDRYVYVIELKRDRDPQDALDQIAERGYDWAFAADGRKVFRIGATFSTKTRRLEDWKVG